MNIVVTGINHKTSAIGIREKFYLQPVERELLLSELKNDPRVVEAFVLSTCNRTEIYAHLLDGSSRVLIDALFKVKKVINTEDLREHFYVFMDREAVEHLLRVTTGLDSLIIGEKQILGQIKEALEFAARQRMLSKTFNILANIAIEAGKKARRETQIDLGGSSVSWAAVMMAQDILGSLEDKTVLILGSGKMGRLAVQQLSNKGVKKIYIMNRTMEKAEELARGSGGVAVPFWDMNAVLPQADVCICSASCTHYLIDRDLAQQAMQTRKEQKLVYIDISVPRNIDPRVAGIKNTFLLTVDDLDQVVEDNIQKRLGAVGQVEAIVLNKVREFYGALAKKGEQMETDHRGLQKAVVFGILTGFVLWMAPAHANLKEIKAYKEAFPDSKPKCINCHETEKPKKDEGLHEWNDYGKAARAIDPKPTAEVFKKLGPFEDFLKNTKSAGEEKK